MGPILPSRVFAALFLLLFAGSAMAQSRLYQLTLKNGAVFEGKFSSIDEISKDLTVRNVTAGGVTVRNIVIVDDELRRTFFPKRNLAAPPADAQQETVIKINRRNQTGRKRVGTLGAVFGATPFNKFGRRTITVMTNEGRQTVAQEIVEISPIYTRLQSPKYDWDMRIATSSIPADQLRSVILAHGEDPVEARLDLVRILFLSDRYRQATAELAEILKQPDVNNQKLDRQYQILVQQSTELVMKEIQERRRAGQHKFAAFLLNGLGNTGAATESLIQASEILAEYEGVQQKAERVLTALAPLVESADGDPPRQKMIAQLHEEIRDSLNIYNLPRMADFLNLVGGTGLQDDEKLAIAMSGWLLGQGQVIQNLEVASSLLEVRNLVREYLRAMGPERRHIRKELLSRIADREGGTPEYVDRLLQNMVPPLDFPEATEIPGHFVVDVPGMPEGFPVRYTVQLPPEYDPYSNYPAAISLHGSNSTPEAQIVWWAGEFNEQLKMRGGMATRNGYIVIAPHWTKKGQKKHEFSAREHHVVLTALRDAFRRFSIDSDRVFISGHALGADAAWDIAVSHPDLWAGMVLIGARADYGSNSPQYVTFYDRNPKHFPMYFVFGELDGNKIHSNSIHLNRYMRPGYDPVIVQYQGRGNEHFFEESPRVFEWMALQQRSPIPREFEVDTMRPWDNFFWFTEFARFSSRTMVSPFEWPAVKPVSAEIKVSLANNRVNVRSGGAAETTVWFSPELFDFDKRVEVSVNGKKERTDVIPDLETLLEDARQRADRKHVYWAKVTVSTGR